MRVWSEREGQQDPEGSPPDKIHKGIEMVSTRTSDLTQGSVTSRDGTRIGYLKIGQGPAVVLVHGSMESAGSHTLLARALADDYTVYLPDRRGRGMSGPHRPDHSIQTEVEDLAAVIAESGAQLIFGVSAGGLVVLEAARTLDGIRKIALYEPALIMDGTTHTAWLTRFDAEMAEGRVAEAMITSMFGLDLAPAIFKIFPRKLLASVTDKAMRSEDKKATPGQITMRTLAPTLHYEGALLTEMAGTLDTFRGVSTDVLLMGGGKGLPFLRAAREALPTVLPHSRRVEFPGFDHGSSSDPSQTNPSGKPAIVAQIADEIRRFFGDVVA